ncbi:hypothetical protein [Segetibacter sp. 3557_3]|uniref:hypothetical protein n=1 Tax=Segetibacter sp. 3557_3 TaxID=2547429 RepID=UPI001FB801AD|nr:hypothetical protein [Segetibacter sp. 3557_3]
MYEQFPKEYYPKTLHLTAELDYNLVCEKVAEVGFDYPFIAKPEVGMQGLMVRKIHNLDELKTYHERIQADYLVQAYLDLPLEFSVFHVRYPGQTKGKVTGFILKEYLQVVGDGSTTLLGLIQQHPKARYREDEMRQMHGDNLDKVITKGEVFQLSFTGNHNRGARFINLHSEIDERLTAVFDTISNNTGAFYYGRYDLKCTSIEDLKAGRNIMLIEFNGAGAEPNHIYDCGMSYLEALKEIAWHWKQMYHIAKINHRRGVPYWSFQRGKRHLQNAAVFFERMRKIDKAY